MMGLVVPLVITALSFGAFMKSGKKKGMTPERTKVFKAAINGSLKDPKKMRELAAAYRKEKLKAQADLLDKRAALKEAPKELKDKRRAAFKQAMASTDKKSVQALANEFAKLGATGAATKLAAYASGLPETPVQNKNPQS